MTERPGIDRYTLYFIRGNSRVYQNHTTPLRKTTKFFSNIATDIADTHKSKQNTTKTELITNANAGYSGHHSGKHPRLEHIIISLN